MKLPTDKKITHENIIMGGALITNLDNYHFEDGVLTVHGFSTISGNYHNTYCMRTDWPVTVKDIKKCLDTGIKQINFWN